MAELHQNKKAVIVATQCKCGTEEMHRGKMAQAVSDCWENWHTYRII